MPELSIKIRIGDREYPMRVDSSEEANLRIAGRRINEQMKAYSDQFGLNDKQDLLAMVAFDIIVDKLKQDDQLNKVSDDLEGKITNIEDLLKNRTT